MDVREKMVARGDSIKISECSQRFLSARPNFASAFIIPWSTSKYETFLL